MDAGRDGAGVSRLVLAPAPRAVREARTFVRDFCAAANITGDPFDTAVLLTSEAVTNAFIHGRSEARLAVTATDGMLLVEVGDDNTGAPRVVDQSPDAVSGRGMSILKTLAATWGVSDGDQGKVVWFTVRTAESHPGESRA